MDARFSFLSRDPDERVLRWGWVFWFAWLLVGGALLLGDYRGGVLGIGVILAAPFWALWALWALYRGGRTLYGWTAQSGIEHLQGHYFEFDGRRIRVRFEGDEIWFAAADVFDALGSAKDARGAERVRGIVGRDGLKAVSGSRQLYFSEKGLAAWLDRRTELNAGKFMRWVEAQVIAPYRRRRELDSDSVDGNNPRVR